MHPYALIPLVTALGAGALASAIVAREPGLRANRLVGGILICGGFWALCELFWSTARDPALGIHFARASSLGSLLIGTLSFHLLLTVQPQLALRLGRLVRPAYGLTALLVASNLATPWFVEDMVRTSWGWAPRPGPAVPLVYAAILAAPLLAVGCWLWSGGPRTSRPLRSTRWIALAPLVPLLAGSLTDFALPLSGRHVPRLGSAGVVVWGALMFWTVYRFRSPVIAPRRFAREILETLEEGVLLLRLDGRVRATNQKMGALVGCEAPELLGRPGSEFLTLAATSNAEPQRVEERDGELRMAAGGRIPVSVSHATMRDRGGNAVGFVLVVRDLSEVASLRSRLITSGRLAAVGQLAAGIAHEINNPVSYVRTNVGLLQRHWQALGAALEKSARGAALGTAFAEGRVLLADCREGVERVAAIVRDVGGFSRTDPVERDLGDVNALLDTAARVAAPQLRGRATIQRDYGAVPLVPCVRQEIMQVFLNLLLNAAQALEGRGTIRLVTRARDDRVLVQVEDDGRGMPPGVQERIFDPFFTTKPAGEGTGLGLSISRQIVSRHGGEIRVESEPGRGSRFEIVLPAGAAGATPPLGAGI